MMNRLTFFKWLFRGAAAVAVAPLAGYLPKSVATLPTTIVVPPELAYDAKLILMSTPRGSNAFYQDSFFVYKHRQCNDTWLTTARLLGENVAKTREQMAAKVFNDKG